MSASIPWTTHVPSSVIEAYRRDGFVKVGPLFRPEELTRLRDAAERHQRGERDVALSTPIRRVLDWQPGDAGDLRLNDYIAISSACVRDIICASPIGIIAAHLAGTRAIRLFNSSLIHKEPRSGSSARVGWHRDTSYWPTCTSKEMLTAWIALTDVPLEMGPVSFVRGSHRWDTDERNRRLLTGRNFLATDHGELEDELRASADPDRDVVTLAFAAGEVSFHHCQTLHASSPNRSDRPRLAIALHLQDESNRYREAFDPAGAPIEYNHDRQVVRDAFGKPDYTDSRFCPQLWPREESVSAAS